MNILWSTPSGLAVTKIVDVDANVAAVEMQQQDPFRGWTILYIGDIALPSDAESFDEVSFDQETLQVVTNVALVRETTKKRLRRERAPLLAALDVQYMRAMEQGQSTLDIIAEKQRLRDITNVVDTLDTIAELRAITCQL